MMKVLVADDERIIREGISNFVPWDSLGLELVASVKDGREALEIIKNNEIDILITDIRMPYLTGLEMISGANKAGFFPATVLISGYDDFSYARQAIKLEIVIEYLLKPVNFNDLIDSVKRAISFREKWIDQSALPEIKDTDRKHYIYKDYIAEIQNQDEVLSLIREGKCDDALESLKAIWTNYKDNEYSLNIIKRFSWENILSIVKLTAETGKDAEIFFDKHDPLKKIAMLLSHDEIYKYMEEVIIKACQIIMTDKELLNPLVETALDLIKCRYSDSNISLKYIADQLNVTPNYLSTLIKKETDKNFKEYINSYRLEQSKKMLIATELKIYEIADKVGFTNSKHFAIAFRNFTGITPRNYRTKYNINRG